VERSKTADVNKDGPITALVVPYMVECWLVVSSGTFW